MPGSARDSKRSSTRESSGKGTPQSFQFASIQNPEEANDPSFRRRVRSHAVKQAIQNKRNQESSHRQNFRSSSFAGGRPKLAESSEKGTQTDRSVLSPTPNATSFPEPAYRIANALTLKDLLASDEAKRALEPVFSVDDNVALQNFHSVFHANLDDPALLNAILFATTFAITGDILKPDCLLYQAKTLKTVRERISLSDGSTTIATLGAILLLAGVEIRLGMRPQVEIHMKAVGRLLESTKSKHVYLTDGIKRAIFWQDLNAHVLTASERTVAHTTFPEMHWQRDLFSPELFILPPAFASRTHLLDKDFIEVLKDVHALSCIRDSPIFLHDDTVTMMHVDNQEAWIQSRLSEITNLSFLQECCRLAAYLCASMLCCKVWRMSILPPHLSSQLLSLLQEEHSNSVWEGHMDLLAWLLYIGGAHAIAGPARSGYIQLIRYDYSADLEKWSQSWEELREVLRQFIWSRKAFDLQVGAFWHEVHSLGDDGSLRPSVEGIDTV